MEINSQSYFKEKQISSKYKNLDSFIAVITDRFNEIRTIANNDKEISFPLPNGDTYGITDFITKIIKNILGNKHAEATQNLKNIICKINTKKDEIIVTFKSSVERDSVDKLYKALMDLKKSNRKGANPSSQYPYFDLQQPSAPNQTQTTWANPSSFTPKS